MTEDTSTGHECPTAYGAIGDGSVQTTLIGGAAACLSHIMHHPLYTLKSQMMFHGHNFRLSDFIRKALTQRTDFLYRGLVPRTIGVAPEKMMKMLLWDKVNIFIDNNYNTSVYTKWLISGAAAGAATTVVGIHHIDYHPSFTL
jgi:solute carrier family 25 aspartate/glutamate transporter 12/13/solute carrier family 25 carnitine/acylcarnitine transporter 20/29